MSNFLNIFFIMLILLACNGESNKGIESFNNKPDSIAVSFNNKATQMISNGGHSVDSLSDLFYDSALVYLDQALKIDSLYVIAYTNKAHVLRIKGDFRKSLEVLKKVELIKPNFPEILMQQGFILEKTGDSKLAFKYYKRAIEAYENRLFDTSDPVKVKMDMAFAHIFLQDRNKGLEELRFLILEYPNNQQLQAMERYFENFDREEFIRSF